jgi:hypothetical protein
MHRYRGSRHAAYRPSACSAFARLARPSQLIRISRRRSGVQFGMRQRSEAVPRRPPPAHPGTAAVHCITDHSCVIPRRTSSRPSS